MLLERRTAPPAQLAERIAARYRWVAGQCDPGWLAIVVLFIVAVAVVSSDAVASRSTAVVWLVWMMVAEYWFLARRSQRD